MTLQNKKTNEMLRYVLLQYSASTIYKVNKDSKAGLNIEVQKHITEKGDFS